MAGALTLTASSNTYTGATTIGGGTLTIGGGSSLGAGGSYAAAISNSGAFVYSSTANQTINAAISGPGSLNQKGPGTLTILGQGSTQSTYSGGTTVNGGTLALGNGGSMPGQLVGSGVVTNQQWRRRVVAQRQLPDLQYNHQRHRQHQQRRRHVDVPSSDLFNAIVNVSSGGSLATNGVLEYTAGFTSSLNIGQGGSVVLLGRDNSLGNGFIATLRPSASAARYNCRARRKRIRAQGFGSLTLAGGILATSGAPAGDGVTYGTILLNRASPPAALPRPP